jgi:hypothetical protein
MAGIGRFKLTDALPATETSPLNDTPVSTTPGKSVKGKSKGKAGSKSKGAGSSSSHGPGAEQLREARENTSAKNAESSTRDRMVDIGRGNQQAGRQRSGGGK